MTRGSSRHAPGTVTSAPPGRSSPRRRARLAPRQKSDALPEGERGGGRRSDRRSKRSGSSKRSDRGRSAAIHNSTLAPSGRSCTAEPRRLVVTRRRRSAPTCRSATSASTALGIRDRVRRRPRPRHGDGSVSRRRTRLPIRPLVRLVAGERQREQDRGDRARRQLLGIVVVDREQLAGEVVAAALALAPRAHAGSHGRRPMSRGQRHLRLGRRPAPCRAPARHAAHALEPRHVGRVGTPSSVKIVVGRRRERQRGDEVEPAAPGDRRRAAAGGSAARSAAMSVTRFGVNAVPPGDGAGRGPARRG